MTTTPAPKKSSPTFVPFKEEKAAFVSTPFTMLSRLLAVVVVGSLLVFGPRALAAPVMPVLRAAVTVDSDVVTLGDLVENAGPAGAVAIFQSPDLGTTGDVPVRDILKAALSHGLYQINAGTFTHVAVTRASRAVKPEEVIAALRSTFAEEQNVADLENLDIQFSPALSTLQLPTDSQGPLDISGLTWTPGSGSFSATLTVGRKNAEPVRLPITGTAQDMVSVVTIARDVTRGTALGIDDVAIERRPRQQAAMDAFSDDAQVIGFETKRAMRPGQMLRAADIAEPEMVKRGAGVTLVYRTRGLTLTVHGQAVRGGRRGETISVMNTQSKRVVEGAVTGLNEITVSANRPSILASR